jgi:hypothetical protein
MEPQPQPAPRRSGREFVNSGYFIDVFASGELGTAVALTGWRDGPMGGPKRMTNDSIFEGKEHTPWRTR